MEHRTTGPLKAVVNDQKGVHAWCGPTVVAAITGKPISVIKAAIKMIRRCDRPVKSTNDFDVRQALLAFGYICGPEMGYRKDEQPTLAAWLRGRTPMQRQQTIIVSVTGHWVVVRGNTFLDTFTKGQPVRTSEAPRRRIRVQNYFVVREMDEKAKLMSATYRSKTIEAVKAVTMAKKVDPDAKSRADFHRQIKRLKGGMTYKTGFNLITVFASENHVCTKWAEWEFEQFDGLGHWQKAADFLKKLEPTDFKVSFKLRRKAA